MIVEAGGTLSRARRHPFPRARTGLWGIVDQAVVSAVNFLTIVVVARTLVPADFGYFVIAFTLLQSAGTLQAALVTRPHNVLGALRRDRDYVDYSTTAAAAQVALTTSLAAVAAAAAGIAYALGSSQWLLILALVPALFGWQLQELGRRMLYTERRLVAALVNDLLTYGAQAAALVLLWQLDLLTATRALLTLAATFGAGAVLVAWQLRPTLSGRLEASSLAASWRFGKWLGVAEVGQWFSTHYYVYLAALVIGPIASAALKAGQTLLGPISVFLTFVTSYLPTVLARERAAIRNTAETTRRTLLATLLLVVPYCLLMALFATPVLELVYGTEYGQYASVVRLFALYYVLLVFSTVAVAVLSAREMTRDIFAGQAAGAALSLAIGWLLLREYGPAGAVAGMLASWVLAMALFLRALRTAPDGYAELGRAAPAPADDP